MASSVDGLAGRAAGTVRRAPNRSIATAAASGRTMRPVEAPEPVMKRTPIRVEPISGYLEAYRKGTRKGPIHPVVVAGEMVFISGLPPFDPDTGETARVPTARQAQLVHGQLKPCLDAAGASLSPPA